jgi:arsenate reductase
MENNKKKVLFICKNNSGRSQMAEGLLRHFYGHYYEVYSAGSHPKPVNILTKQVLAEIGIDISRSESKGLEKFKGMEFDYVVTLCEDGQICPLFIGGEKYIHHRFTDPASYKDLSSKKELFRALRDEIRDWIQEEFPEDR